MKIHILSIPVIFRVGICAKNMRVHIVVQRQPGHHRKTRSSFIVLASSLTKSSYQGSGLNISDFKQVNVPVLWVHHKHDPCRWTSYADAKYFAQKTRAPLLTVTGSKNNRGDACKPFTEHGFVGMEEKTVKAILAWIRTGQVPSDVSE